MNCSEILSALDGLNLRGMDFGLNRTRALLDGLGAPDKKLKIIHIAGTNGKGSVAGFMTEILLAAGKTVGTFTSPAVYDYFEQFRIDGKNIEKNLFEAAFSAALELPVAATRFEYETAGAVNAFALAGCEYAVIECGLGGRYDATNAVLSKKLALITSISEEHLALLGGSIEGICYHKSGIIKGCPAVVSACMQGSAREYFTRLGAAFTREPQPIDGGFIYGSKEYKLTANGCMQPYNAAVAIDGARLLGIAETAIYAGVKRFKPLGRLETIRAKSCEYILDGAHNPEAFKPLCDLLERTGAADTVIYGSLSDKDICGNILQLKGLTGEIIVVTPPSPRAMNSDKVVAECLKLGIPVRSAESVSKALEAACGRVVVCGTFTLLKEAKNWIEKRL